MTTGYTVEMARRAHWGLALILAMVLPVAGCAALRPARTSVTIEWTTETELDVAGFNLYRSESPDGPFEKINEHLIPGAPDPLLGGRYTYTDTEVEAGKTYFYKLEDVELDGASTFHGPIEVRAEGGGWLDWLGSPLVAVVLAGLGGAGIVWWYLRYRR